VPAYSDSPRALIRYALAGLALTAAITWGLYLARGAVLLIYISVLVAVGLAPLAGAIERHRWPGGRRLPRWAAILVMYLCFLGVLVGVGVLVIPPLVMQARELWSELPEMLQRGQQWLIDRGLLAREMSISEALAQAPGTGGDAVGTLVGAVWGFFGGVFGLVTILILAFYLMLDAERFAHGFVRLFPRAERRRVEEGCRRISTKVSAWLGGQLLRSSVLSWRPSRP
jgi:predicted PurR-regulated permease PerM